jgi:hypothetical protein
LTDAPGVSYRDAREANRVINRAIRELQAENAARRVSPCVTPGPDGRPIRQYVRREIYEQEAASIRRIFELCARGDA